MPIKPENRGLYPADWRRISAQIRQRAGHCCEWEGCGIPNYSVGRWIFTGRMGVYAFEALPGDVPATYAAARKLAAENSDPADETGPLIVIVLTVAHLNHDPGDCRPDNLRAWCQRHHLLYDAGHHRQSAYRSRRSGRALDMFEAKA